VETSECLSRLIPWLRNSVIWVQSVVECFHGVRAVGDFDAANARDGVSRIESQPLCCQIHFAIGVEIDRRAGVHLGNVWQRPGHVAPGQIEGATQSGGGVGEVAADAVRGRIRHRTGERFA
jgi:hypothetical protein